MEALAAGRVCLHLGDCIEVLATLPECSVDAVVTDPPYHLTSIVKRFGADNAAPAKSNGATGVYARASVGFMGQRWDGGDVAFRPETWASVLRVLRPGGHLLAMGGTRTFHRLACAIEDAGFEIRDMVAWLYGSGFPKSHDVSKAIDRMLGADREKVRDYNPRNPKATGGGRDGMEGATRPWIEAAMERGYQGDSDIPATWAARQWDGFGTALKPAMEPCCLARKPLDGTIAENVMRHGTGALNVDGARVENGVRNTSTGGMTQKLNPIFGEFNGLERQEITTAEGRWPANVVHDGSDEVVAAFSAARFFYTAKADADDRLGSRHPTVKPLDLIQYLVRLITPPGGVVLDPFAGTGTTGEAAVREGMRAILIEREANYYDDIRRRMALVFAGPDERRFASVKARGQVEPPGPLFEDRF